MSNVPAVISSMIATLETAQAVTPASDSGDFQYLKMTKIGEWVYGSGETEVGSDSAFVIDPMSYAQGYVAWYDGELIDEQMAAAGAPPILLADLPALPTLPPTKDDPNGAQWAPQVAFALKGIEGAEDGVQLLYKVSSKGGRGAIAELLSKIIARGKAGEGDVCPIVLLETTHYKHKKYGKIFTPVLTVDEWTDMPEPAAAAPAAKEVEAEPVVEPEPVVETESVVEAKPKRKRSRKSA
jgi:hypothetical protein